MFMNRFGSMINTTEFYIYASLSNFDLDSKTHECEETKTCERIMSQSSQ